MQPEDTTQELATLATNIETFRRDLGLPKAVLLRQYPELGTDKTYTKLSTGDTAELNVEKWLSAYKHVWASIQEEEQSPTQGLLDSLHAPTELCRAYLECRQERGSNARFILVLGDSGTGKSSAVKIMQSKGYGNLVVDIEAADAWRGGRGTAAPLLRAIARKLGIRDLPTRRDDLLIEVVEKLQAKRLCLVVDEIHHLCPSGLNTLKSLINQTPVIIVGLGMPVIWDRLASSRAAYAECKQLTGNRLAERIYLSINEEDVSRLISQRLTHLGGFDSGKAAKAIAPVATAHGNMLFVDRVLNHFIRETRRDQPATLEVWANAIALMRKRRA